MAGTLRTEKEERIFKRLGKVFEQGQASVLTEVITEAYADLVKTSDFNELKEIVKDIGIKVGELAEAQKRTEIKVEELAEVQKRTEIRVEELAEAQKRTEIRVEELAEAQKRTEIEVKRLAEAQRKTEIEITTLTKGLTATRGDVGGLSKSMSYAFENEAFRMLPGLLRERYGIEIKEKMIRADIGGKEINIFATARKNGKDVVVVGESKLRLDERKEKKTSGIFEELEDKVKTVREEYKNIEPIKILITHYATGGFLKKAKEKGVIVVQSFEW